MSNLHTYSIKQNYGNNYSTMSKLKLLLITAIVIGICIIALAAAYIVQSVAQPQNERTLFNQNYKIQIPSGTLDITIPKEFNLGYGGVRTSPTYNKEYQFDETQPTSRLNDPKSGGIKTLLIGTLFINPTRNFGSWDATVDLGVINYENSVLYNIENFNDLKSLFTEFASESYLLTNGEEVNDLGKIREEVFGENKTLVLTRKDPYTIRKVFAKDSKDAPTDVVLKKFPYQTYLILLEKNLVLRVEAEYWNEKFMNLENYEKIQGLVESMIKDLKYTKNNPINKPN